MTCCGGPPANPRGRRAGAGWRCWRPRPRLSPHLRGLAWWTRSRRTAGVVDRALAAIGDGPVLHVVTRSPAWAARSSTSRAASAPSSGSSRRPGSIRPRLPRDDPPGRNRASRSTGAGGQAGAHATAVPRDAGVQPRLPGRAARGPRAGAPAGQVAGTPVYWLRVTVDSPAPPRPGCAASRCQDVAVSRETYEPVYVRFGPPERLWAEGSSSSRACRPAAGEIPRTATSTTSPGFVPLPRRSVDRRARAGCSRLRSSGPAVPGRPRLAADGGGWRARVPLQPLRCGGLVTEHPTAWSRSSSASPRRLGINEAPPGHIQPARGPAALPHAVRRAGGLRCRRGARPSWRAAGARRSCAGATS